MSSEFPDGDIVTRLYVEAVLETPIEKSTVPSTPENDAFREKINASVAQTRADHPEKDWYFDIPNEWPDIQVPNPVPREDKS